RCFNRRRRAALASLVPRNDDAAPSAAQTANTHSGADTMAKTAANAKGKAMGMSLHIGLNSVSGGAYGGWTGPLAACEADAKDMTAIAKQQGMRPTTLLTKKATRAAVLAEMRKAAQLLAEGDLYFLSYSGHGGQV